MTKKSQVKAGDGQPARARAGIASRRGQTSRAARANTLAASALARGRIVSRRSLAIRKAVVIW